MDQPVATGQFSTPGSHVVNVRAFFRGTMFLASTNIQVNEAVPAPPRPVQVQLSTDKPRARVGEVVTFTVSTIPEVPNLNYQFDAGDDSPMIANGKTRRIPHIYKKPINYTASVTLIGTEWSGRAELAISVDRPPPPTAPTITPSPIATSSSTTAPLRTNSFPWNYVILSVLVVAIIGYLLQRKPKPMAAPPTFHLRLDHSTPQKPQNMAIKYELHFDPNLSKGSHQLEINGANLIISRRKEI